MPCDFLSRCHYLNALFRHCGVAIIIFIFILPIAEPTRDWGPRCLPIVEAKIGFLKKLILSNLSEFLKDNA